MSESDSNALGLEWAFGFSKDIVGGVHNLTTESRNAMLYVAAHTGVIYDFAKRTQRLLQGHCNPITACCVSADRRWIATADAGPESMIVVWDALTGTPIKTIFSPHPKGVLAMDMSPDAMFLATLSNVEKESEVQSIALWEWTVDREGPLYTAEVTAKDTQSCVRFNPGDVRELVTNGVERVIFWSWEHRRFKYYSPPLTQGDFKQEIGAFTQTIFVPGSTQAVTGTVDGDVVLWDRSLVGLGDGFGRPTDRRPVKVMRLSPRGAVNVLTSVDGYVVIGGEDGAVRFFDFGFRAVAWFEELDAGAITSVSFAAARPPGEADLLATLGSKGAGGGEGGAGGAGVDSPFSAPDFLVGTSKALVVGAEAAAFHEVEVDARRGTLLVQGVDAPVSAVATHPFLPQLLVCADSGVVQLWDYEAKRLLMVRVFRPHELSHPLSATFDPSGQFLAVGGVRGTLRVLDAAQLEDVNEAFEHNRHPITEICFSHDSQFMATADSGNHVSLYRFMRPPPGARMGEKPLPWNETQGHLRPRTPEACWVYIGRSRAHTAPIVALEFSPPLTEQEADREAAVGAATAVTTTVASAAAGAGGGEDDELSAAERRALARLPRLVSVGEDRYMAEFDLGASSITGGLQMRGPRTRVEQFARPTASCWHPRLPGAPEATLLTANDEFKLRVWTAAEKACRRTVLGPTFGGPITRLLPLTRGQGPPPEAAAAASAARGEAAAGRAGAGAGAGRAAAAGAGPDGSGGGGHGHGHGHGHVDVVGAEFVAYSTAEKVVGLLKLPLDGNPHRAMGLIAHPGEVSMIACSHDGRFLVTAGGSDMTVNLWRVDTAALDAAVARGGRGVEPFLSLLEGGKDGAFYQELRDYFYYSQLRAQGEDVTETRHITGSVPLSEIPNLMRALGFYPSEQEIINMCNEVRYADFARTGVLVEEISIDDFVRLYVNHRPVFALGREDIQRAFETLAAGGAATASATGGSGGAGVLAWRALTQLLQDEGEGLTSRELRRSQATLVGEHEDPCPTGEITAKEFAERVLGFEEQEGT